ncbi:MAG: hypothetical protein U0793_29450 [Gemmataceae bacterium]
MQVELLCPSCRTNFVAPPQATAEEIRDQMTENGAWYALGEGETFEDMIFSTLTEEGAIFCPECGAPVHVSEESLGRLAMEVLSCW